MKDWRAPLRPAWTWGWGVLGRGVRAWLHLREHGTADRARLGTGERKLTTLRSLEPGRFAIFATYPRFPLEASLLMILKQLSERGVQVLVVATTPLQPRDREIVERFASAIIDIGNVGRDFGAYQQGVFHLRDTVGLAAVDRLVFLNDTLYFLGNRDAGPLLDGLLAGEHDYVGANENFDHHYHVGSFCFAMSRRALNEPCFLRFWQGYMPYSTRVHAINNGEVALTRTMMDAGILPHVLYSWHHVASEVRQYLETPDRPLHMFCLGVRRELLDEPSGSPEKLARDVARYFQDHNQVHSLGFFFVRLLGMPYVKKDIVWNGIHLLSDLTSFVEEDQLDDVERVMLMIRQKGTPASRQKFLTKLKSRLQLI